MVKKRESASRANENEEQKEDRTSLAQLILHKPFLLFSVSNKCPAIIIMLGHAYCPRKFTSLSPPLYVAFSCI